jgi:8-oxo-dGTP pyrophosphatase MutT (NUDIX family)
MDLSIKLQDTKVKIRVAGLVKTAKGYLFEKSDKEYIFTLGGKIMLNESSKEAIIRETKEEIGMDVENLSLRGIIENFYGTGDDKVHEICFVYEIDDLFTGEVPSEFVEVSMEDIQNHDIRPAPVVDILKSEKNSFKNIVVK